MSEATGVAASRPRAGRRRAARARPLPADRPRGPRRRRARLAARHAPPADPARQGLGDVPRREGVPAADRVPLPAAGGGLPRAARRHGRPHRRSSSTAATSTACRSTSSPTAATTCINIDHHHDNTRFGDVNLVDVDASCTAEIVYDLAVLLGADDHAGDGLGPLRRPDHRHRQVHVREHQRPHPPGRGRADRRRGRRRRHLPAPLRARADREAAAGRARPGRRSSATATTASSLTYITAADYEATGAGEEMTEGVIDHLRSIEGTKVAAVVRDLGNRGRAARKVSLRSSEGDVDVSAIARKHGGGGHKRAAGFSTDLELDELVDVPLRRGRRPARRLSMADGDAGGAVLLCDKPAGVTSHDVVAEVRRERGCKAGPRRHPRPLRHRPAAGPARPGDAPAALPRRPAEDLPGDGAARLALEHRRPRRRADRDRARCPTRWSCRPARCASGCR